MFDRELQKECNFLRYMDKFLPNNAAEKVDIEDKIKLEYYRLEQTFKGSIELDSSNEAKILTNPKKIDVKKGKDDKDELLENIINKINERFIGIFTDADRVIVETLYSKIIKQDKKLKSYAKKNNSEVFVDSIFPNVFKEIAQESFEESMDAFKKLFEDKDFYELVLKQMAQEAYRAFRNR